MSDDAEEKDLDDLRALARTFGREALMRVIEIMHSSKSDNIALKAAFGVLERGYGKSGVVRMQEKPIEMPEEEESLDDVSSAERIRVLKEALEQETQKMLETVELSTEKAK